MPAAETYAALDLGASGGRVVAGTLGDGRLRLTEAHRFPNAPVPSGASLCWDLPRLWQEAQTGLARVAASGRLAGLGVCAWAQDFVLLDQAGDQLGMPHAYRDPRTSGILAALAEHVSEPELYRHTGLPFIEFTTLCQLLALHREDPTMLAMADCLLFISNLFLYRLSGERTAEVTVASVSQLYDLPSGDWHRALLAELDLPAEVLPCLVSSGTVLAPVVPTVRAQTGLGPAPVIATACHDTAAAVAGVPSAEERFTFLSCGTWSVVGTELPAPLLTAEARAAGFLNEAGAGGRFLLVGSTAGLWPVQECRRLWREGGEDYGHAQLAALAAQAEPLAALVDLSDPAFFARADMPATVREYCLRTGQAPPATPGSLVRCLLESLALRYRQTLGDLARVTGRPTGTLYLVGGGSRNALLCQLTADATGLPVVAGPAEASACGTILLQALALGHLSSLAELRAVVRASFPPVTYEPHPSARWDEAYAKFLQLQKGHPAP